MARWFPLAALPMLALTGVAACGGLDADAASADPPVADGPAGTWSGTVAGSPAQAVLQLDGSTVEGTLDVGGYVYGFAGGLEGATAVGTLSDRQTGGALPATWMHHADVLTLVMAGVPQAIPFTRGAAPSSAVPRPSAAPLDPAMVGAWCRTESIGHGGGGGGVEQFLVLRADGTWQMGTGRMAVGGAGWSGGSGGMQVDGTGRWKVLDRVLHIDAGTGFVPFARVYLEGPKMMLTYGDGSRHVFARRG